MPDHPIDPYRSFFFVSNEFEAETVTSLDDFGDQALLNDIDPLIYTAVEMAQDAPDWPVVVYRVVPIARIHFDGSMEDLSSDDADLQKLRAAVKQQR